MRVLIAGSCSPFSSREEMRCITSLAEALRSKGIVVDSFMLPFVNNPLLIPEQMMALRLLDIENSCDLLLTIGYPAFVLKHRRKRVILFSLASSLHGHFGTEYGILPTPEYQRLKNAVHAAERKCLAEAERIVCASETLAAQVQSKYHLSAQAFILDYDSHDIHQASAWEEGTWVVCESTLEPPDRIDLLLNAVTYAKGQWRLIIFVPSASKVYREALDQQIERLGLKERVLVQDSALPLQVEPGKACLLVTLPFATTRISESLVWAANSEIPVVTATDCGAVLETIQNGRNGLVVDPTAEEIARAVDLLVSDGKLHKKLSQGHRHSKRKATAITKLAESLVQ